MRIAIIVPEFPPNIIGGGGIVYEALSRRLKAKHTIRIFTLTDHGKSPFTSRFTDDCYPELEVTRYPSLPLLRKGSFLDTVLPPNPRAGWQLWQDLQTWFPDVAHLHGIGYTFVDLAAMFLRHLGVPYLLTDHGLPASYAEHSLPVRTGYHAYSNLILKRTVSKAGLVTAVSSEEAELCSRMYHVKTLAIPNGVNPLPLDDGVEPGSPMKLPPTPYLAAAGRVAHNKGFDVLLNALVSNSDLPPCYVAGEWRASQYGRALHERANGRLRFLGQVSRGALRSLFSNAAVVVVPSRSEPFGLVGFEALDAHTRVVATKTGGLFEFSDPQAPLMLVTPGDHLELADAISLSLAKGSVSELEHSACNRTLQRLNWDDIAMRYDDRLAELASRNGLTN